MQSGLRNNLVQKPICTIISKKSIARQQSRTSLIVQSNGNQKPIQVGDKLPSAKFNYFDEEGNMRQITTEDLCEGKKVIIFATPAAFSPTCSIKAVPSFLEKYEELKQKGIASIALVSVNDAFVLDAWAKQLGTQGKIVMLADGSAEFTKAIGVQLDLSDKGLGLRTRRYAMLVDNMEVKILNLEDGGAFTVSSAHEILSAL